MSNTWKIIQEKKEISKHMQKRHKHILVSSQRYKDSRHLLQNPTDPNYVMSFSNRTPANQGFVQDAWPLEQLITRISEM